MEPTNHPFRKEYNLPNLHDYVPAVNLPGCKHPLDPFDNLGPSAACPLPFAGPYHTRGPGNWGSKGGDASGDGRKRLGVIGVALKFGSLALRVFSNLYLGGGFKFF